MRLVPALLALLLFLAPALRAEDEEKAEPPKPHTDAQLKEYEVHEKFEKGYEDDDIDRRMQALRYFGSWRHKSVLKELKKIWRREKQLELLALVPAGPYGPQREHELAHARGRTRPRHAVALGDVRLDL